MYKTMLGPSAGNIMKDGDRVHCVMECGLWRNLTGRAEFPACTDKSLHAGFRLSNDESSLRLQHACSECRNHAEFAYQPLRLLVDLKIHFARSTARAAQFTVSVNEVC